MASQASGPEARSDHLTFRANRRDTRHGWLRLTPAYSVHLVGEILGTLTASKPLVLDPFCGTGTTALVCAERGVACDTTDINPFLVWLAKAKTATYSSESLAELGGRAELVARAMSGRSKKLGWVPALHHIERWWTPAVLASLSRGFAVIREGARDQTRDLLELAFCRTLIERGRVSFGHQSMSFSSAEEDGATSRDVAASFREAVRSIRGAAALPLAATPSPLLCDARALSSGLAGRRYDAVITSPPYPNRMSYIRELRPYMYWLGFLADGRQAGELDWQAMGGTWGIATSNLGRWSPDESVTLPCPELPAITSRIGETSPVLGRYVTKYFHDAWVHVRSLRGVVAPRATLHYIVGNSKFYDVVLPVERLYAQLFEAAGFEDAGVRVLRKRTSKKELYEFVVTARAPGMLHDL